MSGPHQAAGSGRNFGYGRDPAYAGHQALTERYGGGHFSTTATHSARFRKFAEFSRKEGVRDLSRNDPQQLLERYAAHVGAQGFAAAYGQNLISSAQITLRALTGNDSIGVKPSDYAGQRTNVRLDSPGGLDRASVNRATHGLRQEGHGRAAAVVDMARELGMREKEAALADLNRLSREADRLGQINIQEGAKGGRTAERWIHVTPEGKAALQGAIAVRPEGSRNLLGAAESYIGFVNSTLKSGRPHLKAAGIADYHDCRAAYACDRYRQLTGFPAPVVAGRREAPKDIDLHARIQIGRELGHGRIDILVSYIGGRR